MLPSSLCRTVMLVTTFTIALCSSAVSADEPDIRFGVNAAPPFHIPEALQSKLNTPPGFCDELVASVQRHLPELSVEVAYLPHIRIRRLMKREQNLCFPCLIKRTSYNPDYYFSDTVNLYAPHGVITRKSLAEKLIARYGSPLSFETVAQQPELRFAQPSGRKYGDIQPILDQYLIDTPQHRSVFGENSVFNLMAMIAADRVDYTIDYEMMIHFYEQLDNETGSEKLIYIPIKEYQQRPIIGAIGCARNEWGKKAIDSINRKLPAIAGDETFQQRLDFWLGSDRPRVKTSD